MVRRIIEIDEEKCNGCGACAEACHEGAIGMVEGKARLLRDDYCDGLGDCLPTCPAGAIRFVEREAADYDEQAVQAHKTQQSGCPGQQLRQLDRANPSPVPAAPAEKAVHYAGGAPGQRVPYALGAVFIHRDPSPLSFPRRMKIILYTFFPGSAII